jgi:hypothetical protein
MAKYTSDEVQELLKKYQEGRIMMNDMSVEILPEENNVDALLLLRTFNSDKNIDDMLPLVQAFCRQRQIKIKRKDKDIFNIVYDGNAPLETLFAKMPYYLDLLVNCCYAIMLKKLTPPFEDSEEASVS